MALDRGSAPGKETSERRTTSGRRGTRIAGGPEETSKQKMGGRTDGRSWRKEDERETDEKDESIPHTETPRHPQQARRHAGTQVRYLLPSMSRITELAIQLPRTRTYGESTRLFLGLRVSAKPTTAMTALLLHHASFPLSRRAGEGGSHQRSLYHLGYYGCMRTSSLIATYIAGWMPRTRTRPTSFHPAIVGSTSPLLPPVLRIVKPPHVPILAGPPRCSATQVPTANRPPGEWQPRAVPQ